jgi:hypothetical protein
MDHVAHDEGVVESGRLFKVAAGELISQLEQVGYQLVLCAGPLLKVLEGQPVQRRQSNLPVVVLKHVQGCV